MGLVCTSLTVLGAMGELSCGQGQRKVFLEPSFLYCTFSKFLECKEGEVSMLRARLPGVVAVPFLLSRATKQSCISYCKRTAIDPVCFGHKLALWAERLWNSSFCSLGCQLRW